MYKQCYTNLCLFADINIIQDENGETYIIFIVHCLVILSLYRVFRICIQPFIGFNLTLGLYIYRSLVFFHNFVISILSVAIFL